MPQLAAEDEARKAHRRAKLRAAIEDAGGVWDEGWQAVGTIRKTGATTGRLDVFFVTPGPHKVRVRSINEALEHLGLVTPAVSRAAASGSAAHEDEPRPSRATKVRAGVALSGAALLDDLDFAGFEQRALQAPAQALPPTASGTGERPRRHAAPATDGHAASDSDDDAEPYTWEELQAGMWRPGPPRMSAAEMHACEAIRDKASTALRDAQIAALAANEAHEWLLCFHERMAAAAQHLPGESRQLLMSIFDSCAAPCEAHAHASLVASVAGCQLHGNLLGDIDAKLQRERAAAEADAARAAEPWPADSVTVAARRAAGAALDSVQATAELASAVGGGEASAVLASDVHGGAARATSECASMRARDGEQASDAVAADGGGGGGGAALRSETACLSLERADSAAASGAGGAAAVASSGVGGAAPTSGAAVGENATPAASSEPPVEHAIAQRSTGHAGDQAAAAGEVAQSIGQATMSEGRSGGGEERPQRRAKRNREASGEVAADEAQEGDGAAESGEKQEGPRRGRSRNLERI